MLRETLDFTDFFKSSSLIDNVDDCHKIVEVGSDSHNLCLNLSSNEQDVKGWIKNRLSDLQISVEDGHLSSPIMDCIYILLKEVRFLVNIFDYLIAITLLTRRYT